METLFGILYIGVMLYLANYQEATRKPIAAVGWMMNGLVLIMGYLGVVILLEMISPVTGTARIDGLRGTFYLLFCAAATAVSTAFVNFPGVRLALANLLKRRKSKDVAAAPLYNPESGVHTIAVLLAVFAILYYGFIFVLANGLDGIARALEEQPATIPAMLTDFAVNMAVALLGVGLFIRRDVQQTMSRLKIQFTVRDMRAGVVAGIALYIFSFIFEQIISTITPSDMLALWNSAAQALFDSFNDAFLVKGLLMALVYGISEEVLYRGALQPVFGVVLTALLFSLIHLQYLFTPYMLVILALALVFGVLRQRYSTTTAVIAHVIYNFLPFVLAGFLPGVF